MTHLVELLYTLKRKYPDKKFTTNQVSIKVDSIEIMHQGNGIFYAKSLKKGTKGTFHMETGKAPIIINFVNTYIKP